MGFIVVEMNAKKLSLNKKKRVNLVPLKSADLEILWRWINDREQVLLNSSYKPIHEDQHRAWFDSVQRRNDLVVFGIRLAGRDKLIGTCQLHSINSISRTAELQIRLGEIDERNKGYGTEAIRCLLRFGFDDLNLNRIYLHVFSTNTPAIRVYEKSGFMREGLLRQAAYINGRYVDVVMMGILKEEFKDG
jgi:RimJ/RimL family protein N-acetyltransferase